MTELTKTLELAEAATQVILCLLCGLRYDIELHKACPSCMAAHPPEEAQ